MWQAFACTASMYKNYPNLYIFFHQYCLEYIITNGFTVLKKYLFQQDALIFFVQILLKILNLSEGKFLRHWLICIFKTGILKLIPLLKEKSHNLFKQNTSLENYLTKLDKNSNFQF